MEDNLLPWIATAISLGGSLVSYGMMREKVARLEKDLDEHKKNAVTINHFDAVIKPIQETVKETRDDVKKLLIMNSRHHAEGEECN